MSRIHGGLPDYLAPGLSILFVGINPGLRSSKVGHHYAGPSNRFWKLLYEAKLVPDRLTCQDDRRLLTFGYGLTNLIARPTSGTRDLTEQDFLQGREALLAKITRYQPAIVAVLGMSVARVLWDHEDLVSSGQDKPKERILPGFQSRSLAGVPVCVLPNPSGRNAHYSYHVMTNLFVELKNVSLKLSQGQANQTCS
ncbi:MAG: mismatch-specific DNA-glycosylase [Nitrospirota bacterium]|nr:mismatch-specific DNA-glycosylase [Nitrospirota bacterium]MDH5586750.1 mismatch-specific DNA-glycosylase [Nitrospirota bacterium]